MYAVIEDRNQQFRVTPGERVLLPLNDSLESGASVTFDKVCLVGGDPVGGDETRVGAPFVEGATVTAVVEGNVKGPKLTIQKFKRRKTYRCRAGFRAQYTAVRIEKIEV